MRARRGGLATVLLAGVAGVAGLAPVLWLTASPAWAFTAPVKIDEKASERNKFEFAPTVVTIDVDDKVLWTNRSQKVHTITSDDGAARFDSGQRGPGQQFEKKFTAAGTYTYHCEIHPEMTGRIEVVDPSAAPTTTPTQPPPTTATTATTAPPTTTTTAPPATTTTAPTTTTTAPRPAAGPPPQPLPPVPSSAPAPPPTVATSSTTTVPTTTSTTAPPTTTSAPPPVEGEAAPPPAPPTSGEVPPSTEAPPATDPGDDLSSAAGPPRVGDDDLDPATVAMVSALVAVGAFAAWTLIRVRPGRI